MNARKLKFGKAMSAALFVLLLSVAGTKNALAQTQVATLQHGNSISAYYGMNAFVEAYEAAETGDIITLSSGSFHPTTISKAITLRGAGCRLDSITSTIPTVFDGEITLNVPDSVNSLSIEGIFFTNDMKFSELNSPKFQRCNFRSIESLYLSSSANPKYMRNAQFVNCIINEFSFLWSYDTELINSVVWKAICIASKNEVGFKTILHNSILRCTDTFGGVIGGGTYHGGTIFTAYNSIIIPMQSTNYNCSLFNCIVIRNISDLSCFSSNNNNYILGYTIHTFCSDVFEAFDGNTFSFEDSFILKDEIATGFLGDDGTQVGIYGGMMPYDFRPTYMIPIRCNVANQSTPDGMLNVEIEVVDEE